MNKRRITIGIVLIIISVAVLVFWEVKGRSQLLMDEVVVLAQGLAKDTKLERIHLAKGQILKDSRVAGSVNWADIDKVTGKYLTSDMGKKAQLSYEFLREEQALIEAGQSIFAIPSSWIGMKSSSLRRGDKAEIFETVGHNSLGIFTVAFVKDSSGAEVVDENTSEKGGVLERWKGSAAVDHLEVIAHLSDYEKLSHVVVSEGALLLLIQREIF